MSVFTASMLIAATLVAASLVSADIAKADTGAPLAFLRSLGGPGHAQVYPSGLAVGPDGTVVLSDIGNNQVKKFDSSGNLLWAVGSLGSGKMQFHDPRDVAVDSAGTIFVADNSNSRIVRLGADGSWIKAFGGPKSNHMGVPSGVSVRATSTGDQVLVADPGHRRLLMYNETGTQQAEYLSNGICTFGSVRDAAFDAAGNVYVANDTKNDILKLAPDGTCLSIFGTKGTGNGEFLNPYGVAVAVDPVIGAEAVYVADSKNERIQELTTSGTYITQVGTAGSAGLAGTFTTLRRVAVAANGDIWGADPWGYRAERFARTSTGYSYAQTIGTATGPSTTALFNDPHGVGITPGGGVVVADTSNQQIAVLNPDGSRALSCGTGGDGSGQFNWPRGLAVDAASGNIWVADTHGSDLQILGANCGSAVSVGGLGKGVANLNWPAAVAIRGSDATAWVADTGNNRVVSYDVASHVAISAFGSIGSGNGQFNHPSGIATSPATGHVLVADSVNNRIVELTDTSGSAVTVVRTLTDGFLRPEGVGVDSIGHIYVADTGNNRMVVLNPDGSEIATVSAGLAAPASVTVDPNDNVYLTDSLNDRVQEYTFRAAPRRFSPTYMGYATATALTSAQAVTEAQNFDVIVASGPQFTPYLAAMRAANPRLRIYSYVNGLYSDPNVGYPAADYEYDMSGNKIDAFQFGQWLMDPSSPAWQAHVISDCQHANVTSGYDGCFLDNLGEGPFFPSYVTAPPVDVTTGQVWVESAWMAATSALAKAVGAALPNLRLSANGIGSGTRYFDAAAPTKPLVIAAATAMVELFLRAPAVSITSFPSETTWLQSVQMLSDAEALGDSILAVTKVWLPATEAELDQWHTYALATFLLGSSGGSYFNFSESQDYAGLTSTSGQDRVNLGTPLVPFVKTGGVYRRLFTNGLVLVNPTKVPVTVALPSAYKDAAGVSVTSVSLAVNTAAILTVN